jgi:uncharacterized protein involved in exopolysaccharide biosynthesis
LQAAQQRLSDYQQKNNAVGNDDRLDIENSRLTELANQLVAAQAAMYDTQTRQKQMLQALEKNQLEQLPDILGNGLLQSMKADLTRTESKLAEVAVRYGRNHPQYISAAAEAQSLRDRLARELDTAKGSINQAAQIAQQRTAEVQRALDDQRQRILELKQQRDALDVLNREVDSARHTYDAATQRASQVRLESLLNQSSIAILNPAVAPIKPARPKLLLSLVLAIVAGVISGAGVTLFAELMDRRVRSAVDIVAVGGLTVLAELSRPSPKPKIKRLIQAITPAPIPRIQSA